MATDSPREAIVIEHVTRLAHDVAPDWPRGIGDLSYRVVVTGQPDIDCSLAATLCDPQLSGIAMRVVNAIPYVVAAQPGLVNSVDLPLEIPHHAFADA